MKNSEKKLVGIAMIMGGIALVMAMGLPQLDVFNANSTKASSLKSDLASSEAEKQSLSVQIALLEKNIDIPAGIQVKTFTDDTEEQATKELLDQVVNLATNAGNKFISLSPASVDPFLAPPPKPKTAPGGATTAPATNGTADKDAALAEAQASLPPLVTKGYELTVRGTYATLQGFLRSMAKQAMVLDMLNFDLANEATESTPGVAAGGGDPNFPLRLKVTLRLALQRVEAP